MIHSSARYNDDESNASLRGDVLGVVKETVWMTSQPVGGDHSESSTLTTIFEPSTEYRFLFPQSTIFTALHAYAMLKRSPTLPMPHAIC